MQKYRIFILGAQGSGKGTQAMILSNKLRIPALSMGQMMREEVEAGSALGAIVKNAVDTGVLAPDETALEIFMNRISKEDCKDGFIIDGYPRNMAQFNVLKDRMTPTHLVVIDVPRDESMDRMLKRAKIEERPDDDPEIMKQRLDIYENETLPVIDEYQSIGVLKTVNGLGTVEQVARRVEEVIK
ncbi:adenylate kinase [Candidatus Uhrbacteria bacterium CG_4_9_14_0_2_um_filter_41_50]|uniref:Adenylate kinase n=1 Tax=Candidatus Uhrbacteria bacterium CG_4_9_14_0_2_um_filter_41_50 TaxID=1975031 RepID=A0A2M8ENB9_9BACT|nr:MAG: adenylate kinase [Candidatus Uhrbacteria bacterium CG_4_10_14_3_um_filter_41_21]PIZ55378.1 MAG: adenylate kinase [Candidatus Uhrbacteria bacterium CG_4_10_14_0_2_um_filter_41_21]PJB84300.1 MAG: adenylate kinase [Candidatus Uhrbacteria bacterium CG_4_9_14_0_8_um_filter_41_16]PJC24246.1 MAG: adenylate kinase [Candidatus Uhrbacteria bacterium CG_4_9_14_0_2_um_filter_41_50]PJE74852.1 MAG: adenylate kinase [Candidatus Uhrbacteria bacterium CG10_big_fil_rev_8_21_14_0_10_41_26]